VQGFDAVLSEEHTADAELTEHPVEEGVAIVDHIRPLADQLTLNVFVSNTPVQSLQGYTGVLTLTVQPPGTMLSLSSLIDAGLQALGLQAEFPPSINVNVLQFGSDYDFVADAFKTFKTLRDRGQLLTVVTPRAVYTNMVLHHIQMSRSPQTGSSGAQFSLGFKAVRVVSSSVVDAPQASIPSAEPKTEAGPKATDDTDVTPKQSDLIYGGAHI
jgi:hypothetical protein